MRIGLVQMPPAGGDAAVDTSFYEHFAAEAVERGCSLVLFPELSDTGYRLSLVRRLADVWPGSVLTAIQKAARQCGISIIAGLSERVGDQIYNAAAAVDRSGSLCGHYRKTHLFCGPEGIEHNVFQPGDRLEKVTMDGVCWGLTICFDLRFPEVYRHLALTGAQVLVNVAAWPRARIADWKVLCQARAIENQVFFVGVNQCGSDGENDFGGASCVISPNGDILAEGGEDGDHLVIADLEMEAISRQRTILPVITARRPSLYN